MKNTLKLVVVFILLISCDAKRVIEGTAKNEQVAIEFLAKIDVIITGAIDIVDIEHQIKNYFDILSKNNKVVELEAKLFFAAKEDPIIIEFSRYGPIEFAYTQEKDLFSQKNEALKIIHGLIYLLDRNKKMLKGSLAVGKTIYPSTLSSITSVETKITITY